MAKIVGVMDVSHIPAIANAINKKKQHEPYWKLWFDAFPPVHDWLAKVKPTTAVVFFNDHGLNFFLDKMPTFAIGVAPRYEPADEGWGIPTFSKYRGNEELSWAIREALHEAEIDMVVCQEMVMDHGITIPFELFWPNQECPVKIVPISINTILFPTPTPSRCEKLGRAAGAAIEKWDSDERVVIIGTGGLSHQLEGKRAGFINKRFDLDCMANLVNNVEWFRQFSCEDCVELAGTQGLELLNWIASRSAYSGKMKEVYKCLHIPISNTAAAIFILEPA